MEPEAGQSLAVEKPGWVEWAKAPFVKLGALCDVRATWRLLRDTLAEVRESGRNPGEQFRRAMEDSPQEVEKLVGKRIFAALAISEVVGTYIGSPVISTAMQYLTVNGYNGVWGSIIGDYFPAVGSFAAAWVFMNRDRYREGKSLLERAYSGTGRYLREMLPTHAACLVASAPAYAVGAAISCGCVYGLNLIASNLGNWVPAGTISGPMNMVIGEAIFLGLVLTAINKKIAPDLTAKLTKYWVDRKGDTWATTGTMLPRNEDDR